MCTDTGLKEASSFLYSEAKLNWSGLVRNCVRKGVLPPKENFFKFDALRSLLRPFLDPSSALSVALGRLDSDSIWHVHMRRISESR